MVSYPPRRRITRAWLAIALAYLLGLNTILVVAASSSGDAFGVVCAQGRSAPDQSDHNKTHACCLAAQCGMGAALLGPPAEGPGVIVRYASLSRHIATMTADVGRLASRRAFGARAPPSV